MNLYLKKISYILVVIFLIISAISCDDGGGGSTSSDPPPERENHAPVAFSKTVSTPEDTAVEIVLEAADTDGDELYYTISAGPGHGSIENISGNRYTYTPNASFNGEDTFSFTVWDGELTSSPGIITINIGPINDQPVVENQNVTLDEDSYYDITLSATDADGDDLTFEIDIEPEHGTIEFISDNVLRYTPDENFYGSDSITFHANDGIEDSNNGVISITVTPDGSDEPVANDQTVTINEDASVEITLVATDADGDDLVYNIDTEPSHGSISQISGSLWEYSPDPDFFGSDSFTFYVNDGTSDSNVATVSITVSGVNEEPTVTNQTITIDEDTSVTITLSGSDPDGDDIEFFIDGDPVHGSLVQVDEDQWEYTPDSNYNGIDNFYFYASDGSLDSENGVINIIISSIEDAPVAYDDSAVTDEDTAVVIELQAEDFDGLGLSYYVRTNPAHGTLSRSGNLWTYTPDADYNGDDSFQFYVNNTENISNDATVAITVNPVYDICIANDSVANTLANNQVQIEFDVTNVDGSALTYVIDSSPSHGTLSEVDGAWYFDPDTDYIGVDSFTFHVNDGTSNSNTATVTVNTRLMMGVWFARSDASAGGDGLTWDTAVQHPSELSDLVEEGDEIWVCAGTYYLDVTGNLYSPRGGSLLGGFNGISYNKADRDPSTNVTILNANYSGRHVMAFTNGKVDGFTIRNSSSYGVYMYDNSTLENCTVENHGEEGVRVYYWAETAYINNCIIQNNTTSGVTMVQVSSTFMSVYIDNCIIRDNSDRGVYVNTATGDQYPSVYISNSQISGHECGIYMYEGSSVDVTNCLFYGNHSSTGGAIYTRGYGLTIESSTFSNNTASTSADAVSAYGSNVNITNSIFWGDVGSEFSFNSCTRIIVANNCIEGGYSRGTNILTDDPLFVDAANDDFHLSHIASGQAVDSPMIDAGSAEASYLGLDTMTTRTDGVNDTGIADLGYHYP